MSTKADTASGALDTIKLAVAALVAFGGLFAYYWFADASVLLRVPGLFMSLVLALVIAFQSTQGKQIWDFIKGSQVEIRKVVWPGQQETLNTTLIVLLFTVLLGVFFLGVDAALLWVRRSILGGGG